MTLPLKPFDENRSWLVVASAGCGKTYQIERCIEGLLESGVKPTEIMYLLFNKRPAEEFKNKFRLRGLTDEDMAWWGTHHSIARRLLHVPVNKILRGKKLKDWGAEHGFDFNPASDDTDSIASEHEPTAWDEVLRSLEVKLYDEVDALDPQESRLLEALSASEISDGVYTDTRYLLRALNMKLVPAGVKYVFVDEGQDNGIAQFRYFKHLIDDRSDILGFMMAGDDKQAINGFKGGRSALFLRFSCDRYVCLPITYRCPPRVLAEMNQIISPVKERSPITTESAKVDSGHVYYISDLQDCFWDMVNEAKKGKSQLVLARNNCFLRMAYSRMRNYGVPMKLKWLTRMRDVVLGLGELHKTQVLTGDILGRILPSDKAVAGDLLKTPYFKRGAVKKLRTGDYGDDFDEWELYTRIMGDGLALDDLTQVGFTDEFIRCVKAFKFPASGWNAKEDDLFYFKQVMHMAGESYEPVELLTIHRSKGGEADHVWAIRNITQRTQEGELEDEDDERRVWYVASSRARERLIFTKIEGRGTDLTTSLV